MLAAVPNRCDTIQEKGAKSWLTKGKADESKNATSNGAFYIAPFYKWINEHETSCRVDDFGKFALMHGGDPDLYSLRHIRCACVCVCVYAYVCVCVCVCVCLCLCVCAHLLCLHSGCQHTLRWVLRRRGDPHFLKVIRGRLEGFVMSMRAGAGVGVALWHCQHTSVLMQRVT